MVRSPCCWEAPEPGTLPDQVSEGLWAVGTREAPQAQGTQGWWMEREESDHPAQLGHTKDTGATKVLENRLFLPGWAPMSPTSPVSFLVWHLVEHREPAMGWKQQPGGLAFTDG